MSTSSENKSYTPTHPEFVVEFAPGDYRSSLKSLKAFRSGQVMAYLREATKGEKAYTTVQSGPAVDDHVSLNSDLVYINHSCEPNAAFDLSSSDKSKWQLKALRNIKVGDEITFFYPSTEWDMDQPFACACGTPTCLRSIQGAKYISKKDLLVRGYVSPWILRLVDERDGIARSLRQARSRL